MPYDFFSLSQEKKEKVISLFDERIDKNGPNGCWIWKGSLTVQGYGRVVLKAKEDGEWKILLEERAHRLSWMLTYKVPIPKGLLACHSCDVKECVRAEHIFIGTPKQNIQDCKQKDRIHKVKLCDRLKIAQDVKNGLTKSAAALKYGVGETSVLEYTRSKEAIAMFGKIDISKRGIEAIRKPTKSVEERFKIAEEVLKGRSTTNVAREFCISATTVTRYVLSEEVINKYGKIDLSYRKIGAKIVPNLSII